MPRTRPRDKLGTSQGHLGHLGLVYVSINAKGTECPRDRRDISRDRWDVSPRQTGRTPGGVPPKFFMFIGFFFPHVVQEFSRAARNPERVSKESGAPKVSETVSKQSPESQNSLPKESFRAIFNLKRLF